MTGIDKFSPFLTRAAKDLEKSGAEFVVMPCNTLHVHEKKIRSAITVPFVSIVDASVLRLREMKITRIGILGSRLTNKHNLFKQRAPDITFVSVPSVLQNAIDTGLDTFVVLNDSTLLRKALHKACIFLKQQDLHNVLVACTDFNGIIPPIRNIAIHDTLDILVRATINML
ncbi:MAG: aspartate/glutamate racemase family protein [Candidatus Gottesmanbacteria bacterium]|nr:aspartate/glutamate racemase family protein [Candidatus Gottesmanbacteria bacterium]